MPYETALLSDLGLSADELLKLRVRSSVVVVGVRLIRTPIGEQRVDRREFRRLVLDAMEPIVGMRITRVCAIAHSVRLHFGLFPHGYSLHLLVLGDKSDT